MRVYHDTTPTMWSVPSDITKLGKQFGKLAGVTMHPSSQQEMFLFVTEETDKMSNSRVKVCHYITPTTAAGGLAPMIQIDLEEGKIHFLSQTGQNSGLPLFEKRGRKLEYLRMLPNM